MTSKLILLNSNIKVNELWRHAQCPGLQPQKTCALVFLFRVFLQNALNDRSISGGKFLGVQIIIHFTALSESGDEKNAHCEISRTTCSLSLLTKRRN